MATDVRRDHPRRALLGRMIEMLSNLATRIVPGSKPSLQNAVVRTGYELVSTFSKDVHTFLNFGYEPITPGVGKLALRPEDEPDRYSLQLYDRIVAAVCLTDKDVLEVGSGRGGGASFVMRYYAPRSMTGMDLAARAVRFCRRRHRIDGLTFVQGDAERMPFPDQSFDVVVNVESSHCYPSFEGFLGEVARVLRDGGYFLFADGRVREDVATLYEQLRRAPFTILEEELITENVLRALRADAPRRLAVVERTPRPFRSVARNFTAVEGSPMFEALRSGRLQYLRFVIQKRVQHAPHRDGTRPVHTESLA